MTSHLNKKNLPKIVDISKKKKTSRFAIAEGIIQFSKKLLKKLNYYKVKKEKLKI